MVFRLGGFLISAEERRSPLVIPSTAIGVTERLMLAEFRSSEKDLSDFVNHSCEPNCGFSDAITVVAARAIPGGDELTIDYGYWELDDAWEMVACKCGSVQCRGNVRGTDWLLDGVVERYQAWASPFIRRRITAKRNGGNT